MYTKRFHVPPTTRTPEVNWSDEASLFSITGTSVPENALQFYRPAIEFCETVCASELEALRVRVDLTYFNSSSMKALFNLLRPLKDRHERGKAVSMEWVIDNDDEFMQESGETLMDLLGLPFHFVPRASATRP